MRTKHISICVCTFKRPFYLQRLLDKLEKQRTGGAFSFGIVVVDNDEARSAEIVVQFFQQRQTVDTVYCCEPRQNIALARNRAIEWATGEWIAFIDDDEFPGESWLYNLVQTCEMYQVSGVLGPVRPHFDQSPPQWVLKGGFCQRPEHKTGKEMKWSESRSGNLLFRRDILNEATTAFDHNFGTGGEDIEFFRRMGQKGCKFVWCNEAVVYESVPHSRLSRSYMLHRALLRGQNGIKRPQGRMKMVAKSIVAVPLYLLVLPVAMIRGQHIFMKYGIKFCDHFGRLLAMLGLNPIKHRQA